MENTSLPSHTHKEKCARQIVRRRAGSGSKPETSLLSKRPVFGRNPVAVCPGNVPDAVRWKRKPRHRPTERPSTTLRTTTTAAAAADPIRRSNAGDPDEAVPCRSDRRYHTVGTRWPPATVRPPTAEHVRRSSIASKSFRTGPGLAGFRDHTPGTFQRDIRRRGPAFVFRIRSRFGFRPGRAEMARRTVSAFSLPPRHFGTDGPTNAVRDRLPRTTDLPAGEIVGRKKKKIR